MNDENLIDISTRPDFKEIAAKGGRNKKGSKSLKTILKELLSAQDVEGEYAAPVAKKLLQLGFVKGDYRALVEIIDRIEGKAEESADGKQPIVIIKLPEKANEGIRTDATPTNRVVIPD